MEISRIKQLRLENNMNRQSLADEMDISLTALATYERGEREPSATLIVKLAKYFHVTSDFLLGLSDTPKMAEEWPPNIPDKKDAKDAVGLIRESVEMMISSANRNSFGLQSLCAYALIINLLPDIDKFAHAMLDEMQWNYPTFTQFGTETNLQFDGKPLLLALVAGSEDASVFAKRLTEKTNRIQGRIIQTCDTIKNILILEVFEAIKGTPLERQGDFNDQMDRIRKWLKGHENTEET